MNRTYFTGRFLRSALCVILMLTMLLGMTACTTPPATTLAPSSTPAQMQTQPTTAVPTTPPTTLPTTAPTEPTQPTEPEPEPEPLVYELTQEDVDAFYSLLDACEQLSLVGEDLDAIDAATAELDEMYEYLNAQCTIAMIHHYCHTLDATLEERYLDCVDICTDANDAYIQMTRRVYLSDTPAKDHLFEGWTQQDFDDLLAYDEQIAALNQRNAEIEVEYRTTYSDDVRIPLYIEFVQNNNAIARFYGYDNYYDYASERIYERDYGADSIALMRQYAKDHLVPSFQTALENFTNRFYNRLGYTDQKAVVDFLYEGYDTLATNYVHSYMDVMPESMALQMNHMLKLDSVFTDAIDAEAGAFTTSIGERSYCYFGPGYASSSTVIHEGGHYYASRYTDLGAIPLDLAEVHSQGNEWLFTRYMKDVLPIAQYNALKDYLLYEDSAMILICLMVDEFEQIVYTTDLTGYTAADFDAIMDTVSKRYFPRGYKKDDLTDLNSYWRMVVVEQPVYYISYAVSSVAAMSLFTAANNDFEAAMATYQKLCEEPVEDGGFLDNLRAAGLATPFEEEFYLQLKALAGVK